MLCISLHIETLKRFNPALDYRYCGACNAVE